MTPLETDPPGPQRATDAYTKGRGYPMLYQVYADGLYLATQPPANKRVEHFLIADIGNRLGTVGVDGSRPVVVHQCPPMIRTDWLQDVGGCFLRYKIEDEAAAIERLQFALHDPQYAVLWHNCEHFARWVAFGTWESKQLQAVGWIVGLTAVTIAALNDESQRRRSHRRRTRSGLARAARG